MIVNSIFTTNDYDVSDGRIDTRYVFRSKNLNQAEASIGNWIIYYRPDRAARSALPPGYFAMARVECIDPEPLRPGYLLARIADYRDFDRTVAFNEGGHYYEVALRKADGSKNSGALGQGVRNLPRPEFERIVEAGLAAASADAPLLRPEPDRTIFPNLRLLHAAEDAAVFVHDGSLVPARRVETRLVSRPMRDPAFPAAVMALYDNRCAMTGSRVMDCHGRWEAEAAHIWPVAQGGPDSVRNGIALSRSVHWMFDAGLFSIADDYTILVASRLKPDQMQGWPPLNRKLAVPARPELRPHPSYLRFHRENVFEG
ncbi:HNH endonuclease [Kaistia granuli]|uniref:HNH endonuclease n=1 Tax=Kaistia granuli TaxID=363259 RepID=UPI000374D9EC|nr:HNH endonuclease [Kaistia granuli]